MKRQGVNSLTDTGATRKCSSLHCGKVENLIKWHSVILDLHQGASLIAVEQSTRHLALHIRGEEQDGVWVVLFINDGKLIMLKDTTLKA